MSSSRLIKFLVLDHSTKSPDFTWFCKLEPLSNGFSLHIDGGNLLMNFYPLWQEVDRILAFLGEEDMDLLRAIVIEKSYEENLKVFCDMCDEYHHLTSIEYIDDQTICDFMSGLDIPVIVWRDLSVKK